MPRLLDPWSAAPGISIAGLGFLAILGLASLRDRPTSPKVAVQPSLPALTVEAAPDSLAPFMALSAVLPAEDWDRLRRAAYQRAGFRHALEHRVGKPCM